jgi:hypothetical protein
MQQPLYCALGDRCRDRLFASTGCRESIMISDCRIRISPNHSEEMALHSRKHPLCFRQRQPDHPRSVFGHRDATADLMNPNGPIAPTDSNTTRHFILNSRTPRQGHPSHPQLWAVSSVTAMVPASSQTKATAHGFRQVSLAPPNALGSTVPFLITNRYLFLATAESIVKINPVFLLISGRRERRYVLSVEVQMADCRGRANV